MSRAFKAGDVVQFFAERSNMAGSDKTNLPAGQGAVSRGIIIGKDSKPYSQNWIVKVSLTETVVVMTRALTKVTDEAIIKEVRENLSPPKVQEEEEEVKLPPQQQLGTAKHVLIYDLSFHSFLIPHLVELTQRARVTHPLL